MHLAIQYFILDTRDSINLATKLLFINCYVIITWKIAMENYLLIILINNYDFRVFI